MRFRFSFWARDALSSTDRSAGTDQLECQKHWGTPPYIPAESPVDPLNTMRETDLKESMSDGSFFRFVVSSTLEKGLFDLEPCFKHLFIIYNIILLDFSLPLP